MRDEIIRLMKELVAIPSISDTDREKEAADYIAEYFRGLDYFKEHPDYTAEVVLEEDYRKRGCVYACVPGDSKKTLVLMGHTDVVAVADYGLGKEFAFDCDRVVDFLKTCQLDEDSRKDLESGEWIFGRGTCDMKGGLAAAMAFVKAYSEQKEKPGSLVFLSVPDEESYSAGMRLAGKVLLELKERFDLDFCLLVDPEPNFRSHGDKNQIVPIGSAGKCMPVILVQGEKAHISKCFEGLNPMGIMGEIFSRTELSLDFADEADGEITVPPTWLWQKDMKEEYDVSVPLRVSGYINMISFSSTPEDILEKLLPICSQAFEAYVDKMKKIYETYKAKSKYPSDYAISYSPCVMTLQQLTEEIREKKGAEAEQFLASLYDRIREQIRKGILNYPQATIRMMDELLTFSGITKPVVLLGFAPPYYPAVRSDHVTGKEGIGENCLQAAERMLQDKFGYGLIRENYTVGLSDTSYTSMDREFDYARYSRNAPLWGELYTIDFETIKKINMPGLILGPWGKDFHKMTERVNRNSVSVELPEILKTICTVLWRGEQ